ncbi:TIGR02186 family protein [Paracoccus sp. (in: a-proteobacteria)]|uniref:TIGR02186 family protein n=1 Tax=Paracoccus sp. TaxID=267 RepID=UPI0026E0F8B4|nr:TIGR02186 family protein [Paracoccus sp. (in: a-proteobacteria)]MDO5370893.1 TIGR02186 family protein [Paracoccus sp. (in: a-proteobacteria)]
MWRRVMAALLVAAWPLAVAAQEGDAPIVTLERAPALPVPEAPPSERLVSGLSQDEVAINATFTGSEILIYGAIRRDLPRTRDEAPGIIVTVEGPSQSVTVRRKDRVGPIWVNTQGVRIGAAPDFYAVASSGSLDRMLDPAEDVRFRISPPLAMRALSAGVDVEDPTPFTEALLRIRAESGRYFVDEGAVQIVDDTLFRADIRLPANLIEGDYRARIFLIRDGQVIDSDTVPIRVQKVGLERWLYRLAMHQPFWYGLMSLAIAMAAGLVASAAFRALRRG